MATDIHTGRTEAADTFELLSRLGFAARGLVYILIGFFAIYGGQAESSSGVLEFLSGQPFGRILVAIVGLGLMGYGLWRAIGAWYDLENEGSDTKGAVKRLAHAGSGTAYVLLSILAFALALGFAAAGGSGGASGSGGAEQATGMALSVPGGQYLVMAAGLGFVVAGLFQAFKGFTDGHMDNVSASGKESLALKWLGRIGYIARGIVFVIVGWFVFQAGQAANAGAAGGPAEALNSLVGWPALALAAGLLVFGIFSLLLAWYRRIEDDEVRRRINKALS